MDNMVFGGNVPPEEPVVLPKVTTERLHELRDIFEKYKAGKAHLDQRVVDAEQWWKLRHWSQIRANRHGDPEPSSGWLVNVILSKHSDAVDAYPEPVCMAREAADEVEAKQLSSILPVVLQQNDFGQVWSDVWWYKLKTGTGVYGVFWDPGKLNGLGDISIRKVDLLNLFWEPGVDDIQKSQYLFCANLVSNAQLEQDYPQLAGNLDGGGTATIRRYRYDDSISMTDKSLVIDCYYRVGGVLHLVKFVNDTVLVATEDDPAYADGLYAHGRYPFVFDPLFPEEGYPGCGYGYVDLCKEPQKIVDILDNCFVKSSVAAATPRWFVRLDGGVNEEEYADLTKPFVHVTGRVDEDSVRQIVTSPMPNSVIDYKQTKINEMKEVSGNRDVNNGGTGSSVTAASAIAALQEAGNGLSRDMINSSYRAFQRVVDLCIELIRQFYTLPRQFRITGEAGAQEYISYTSAGIQMQPMGVGAMGQDMGMRLPVFDIEVEVQAESQYTKQAYNDLAIQLYQLGVFDPNNAQMASMMLEMMDFKGRDKLLQQVRQNGMLQQQLMQWQQMAVAATAQTNPEMAQQLAASAGMAAPQTGTAGNLGSGEDSRVQRARDNARQGAMPR